MRVKSKRFGRWALGIDAQWRLRLNKLILSAFGVEPLDYLLLTFDEWRRILVFKSIADMQAYARSQARTILAVNTETGQIRLFHEIMNKGLTVREVEKKAKRASKKTIKPDMFVLDLEERLRQSLGTKVTVTNKKGNKGKIVIEYYNLDDLDRIVRRIK